MYASQAQEAFLEGHVTALEVTGGVPWRQIRYDNLSPAVAKVLTGRSRAETQRWLAFRAHYGFEAFYCQAGPEGAHEKGGVEGEIGRFRRRWFVPVPRAGSLAELNGVPITLSRPLTWCLLLGEGSSREVSGCAGGTFRHCQYPLSIRSAYLAVVRISGWLVALRSREHRTE